MSRSQVALQEMERILLEKGAEFTSWQQGLITKKTPKQKKGSPDTSDPKIQNNQAQLLEAMKNGTTAFVEYLKRELDWANSLCKVAVPPYKLLSPKDAYDPGELLEVRLWEHWREEIPAAFASQPLFWAANHISWLEKGMFGDDPTACFWDQSDNPAKISQEARTRSTLRRLGGLAVVRGMVSVFQNCPMARAWWRCHMAKLISQQSNQELDFSQVHRMLRMSSIWNDMFGGLVRRVAVILDPSILAAILVCLREGLPDPEATIHKDQVISVSRNVARVGLSYSFALLSWDDKLHLARLAAIRQPL